MCMLARHEHVGSVALPYDRVGAMRACASRAHDDGSAPSTGRLGTVRHTIPMLACRSVRVGLVVNGVVALAGSPHDRTTRHGPTLAPIGWRHHLRWWRGRKRLGRPAIAAEMRALIRRMSQEHVLWGAPRIQGELAKLGVQVSRTTIAKYMVRRPGPPSPTWCTFLRHHASALVAGGAYAELAHRLQASSITVIHVFQRWLDSWTTSGAKQSAQWDTVSLTPPSSTASVPSLWAPAPVDRVCVPERSPPDSQQPYYHDLAPADVPRAIETANMCLAAWAMVRWKVSPFRRRQVPRETTGQARGTSW